LTHRLWLGLTEEVFGSKLHHRDVLGVALRRLEKDLGDGVRREEAIADLRKELQEHLEPVEELDESIG